MCLASPILLAPSVTCYDSDESGYGRGAPSLLGGSAPPSQTENKHSPGGAQMPVTVKF